MSLTPEQRLVVPPDVLINVFDGHAVILNLKSERYFGLDEVGTAMWHALTTSASVEEAEHKLLAEFDVPPERLRHDLYELAEKLIENGLLEVQSG